MRPKCGYRSRKRKRRAGFKEFRQIVAQLSHARAAAWRSEIGALQTRVQAVDPNLSCEAIG